VLFVDNSEQPASLKNTDFRAGKEEHLRGSTAKE